jgi:protease I
MADTSLDKLRVAILATDGVEQVELTEPRKALDSAGAKTTLVSPKDGEIKGWNHTEWGTNFVLTSRSQKQGQRNSMR